MFPYYPHDSKSISENRSPMTGRYFSRIFASNARYSSSDKSPLCSIFHEARHFPKSFFLAHFNISLHEAADKNGTFGHPYGQNFCMKHNYANIKRPTVSRRALKLLCILLIFKAVHHVLQFLRNGKPHPCCVLDDRESRLYQ